MIRDDEDLILQFNPFVCETRKIPMKLKDEFIKLSGDMINHVSEQNRKKFVTEAKKILNNISTHSFYSIFEMIEFFHSAIKQNSVGFNFGIGRIVSNFRRKFTICFRMLTSTLKSTNRNTEQ